VAPTAHQTIGPATLGWNSALLEWHGTALANSRLARGLGALSGEVPPRSRVGHPLGWSSASLEGLTGSSPPYLLPRLGHLMLRHLQAPGSKTNPRRASDTSGNHAPTLFRQPSRWGHPCHYTILCGKASVSSATLCHPLLYGRRAAPSKEDGGTHEGGRTPVLHSHGAMPWRRARPLRPPSALCGHPRHHGAIRGTAAPSSTLWKRAATGHRHARCCAPYGLWSATPSSQHAGDDRTKDSYATTLEAAPGRIQDTPWRPAKSKIRQDGRLLHGTAHHAITRR
jgi:hypothetical protein